MRLLKEGKDNIKQFKCEICECEFELNLLDKNDLALINLRDSYTHCPKCGSSIIVTEWDD